MKKSALLARESGPLDTDHCPGADGVALSPKVGSGGGIGMNGELQAKTTRNAAAASVPASQERRRRGLDRMDIPVRGRCQIRAKHDSREVWHLVLCVANHVPEPANDVGYAPRLYRRNFFCNPKRERPSRAAAFV